MYIPSYYKEDDFEKLLAFITHHSFATLINNTENLPIATHLPFVISNNGSTLKLSTHMSRANEQWKYFQADKEVLVIFQGPHSYISPSNYEKQVNVPTWNYIAVHAYGVPEIIDNKESVLREMEKLIDTYEKEYKKQWESLPKQYIDEMLKGIVAFEINVTKLQGKFKLSQNKTETEKKNIINSLSLSKDATTKELAEEMKKYYKG